MASADQAKQCSPNVTWQEGNLSREARWRALDARGATVWLTGLPASGKSTIGAGVEERLVASGRFAYLLDGDNLRHGICSDLGFSEADRVRNIIRAGELARLFADAGAIAIVALVSPLAAARDEVRALHAESGLRFLEVFVDTPIEVCTKRDPKHLYARALAGEIHGFTGVDDPYEAPSSPDLTLGPQFAVPDAVNAVLAALDDVPPEHGGELRSRGRLSRHPGARPAPRTNGVQR
ncbi:MAG: adenylyl-sulfate kinase [Solirubrobacteraceae bacterium]